MSYQNGKPEGSPACWGWASKYQDGDPECIQCRFRDSCRPVALAYLTQPPSQPNVPLPQKPFVPFYQQPAQPAPPIPIYRPQIQQSQYSMIPAPPPPTPQTYQYQTPVPPYQPQNMVPLDYKNPHPLAVMYRPGAPQPPYFFAMHQGETVRVRLGKNLVLRVFETMLSELALFFRHWMWPPKN